MTCTKYLAELPCGWCHWKHSTCGQDCAARPMDPHLSSAEADWGTHAEFLTSQSVVILLHSSAQTIHFFLGISEPLGDSVDDCSWVVKKGNDFGQHATCTEALNNRDTVAFLSRHFGKYWCQHKVKTPMHSLKTNLQAGLACHALKQRHNFFSI